MILYILFIIVFGFLLVPFHLIWGPEKSVDSAAFAPIWMLIDSKKDINGFNPIYQLDTPRLLIIILNLSIVFSVSYFLAGSKKK